MSNAEDTPNDSLKSSDADASTPPEAQAKEKKPIPSKGGGGDSIVGILLFALLVCLVPAVLVSSVAVSLKDKQDANKLLDKQKNILLAAGMIEEGEQVSAERVETLFENVRTRAVNLDQGAVLEDFDILVYDQRKASKDANLSTTLSGDEDIALIKRRENVALVYEVLDSVGEVERYIFPVRGYGLWSTLWGFLALSADGKVVEGLTFYEHAETPGLGGEVDNPNWKKLWKGKTAYTSDGKVAVRVIKGKAEAGSKTDVDGLSGATITANGVDKMIKFWLGERGYGKFIKANIL